VDTTASPSRLTRTVAAQSVQAIGWRYLLGTLVTSVAVNSLGEAVDVAAVARRACDGAADAHLRLDLRPDRVELSLQTRAIDAVTAQDARLAHGITQDLARLGRRTGGATSALLDRPVQMLEIAIDALDIAAIRPFWKAVLAFVDVPADGPDSVIDDAIVDPAGQLPAIWFQQMDSPRPQRNRVHFDITVAHDEADARVRAALDAGGVMKDDSHARAFWVLADAEGNEVCVCTWQDRD
jgi:4a-hydroxytetrahydrobiopterin dehydratase